MFTWPLLVLTIVLVVCKCCNFLSNTSLYSLFIYCLVVAAVQLEILFGVVEYSPEKIDILFSTKIALKFVRWFHGSQTPIPLDFRSVNVYTSKQ